MANKVRWNSERLIVKFSKPFKITYHGVVENKCFFELKVTWVAAESIPMCDISSKWSGKLNQSQRQSARTKNAISKKKKKIQKRKRYVYASDFSCI